MFIDVDDACAVLDRLGVGQEAAYRKMVREGRLKCDGSGGAADYVDDLVARVVVDFLRGRTPTSLLLLLPDDLERRSQIAFAAALVMEGVRQIRLGAKFSTVVHVSNDPAIRMQLKGVRLGNQPLETVFTQQYAKGDTTDVKTVSTRGGLHLPRVLFLCAPADAAQVLRTQRPLWITADLGDGERTEWLEELVTEARRQGIPLVAWTTSPFSRLVDDWKRFGDGLLAWPRLLASNKPVNAPLRAHILQTTTVTPLGLAGDGVAAMSSAFATAAEALAAARASSTGRLANDAVAIAWRLLRALEGVPVPLEDHDRDVGLHWGAVSIERLATSLSKFLDVLPGTAAVTRELLLCAESLDAVRARMVAGAAPLWRSMISLCLEGAGNQVLVFTTRARREIFRQAMLARFNISEDDLGSLGTRLTHLSERSQSPVGNTRWVFVGVPSRDRFRLLSHYLDGAELAFVLWPHQYRQFERHVRGMNERLNMAVHGLDACHPTLAASLRRTPATSIAPMLKLGPAKDVGATDNENEVGTAEARVQLWKRPELADAIGLLGELDVDQDDQQVGRVAVDDDIQVDDADTTELWVDGAVELSFSNARRLVLASDDTVNLIMRAFDQTRLEERYVRSIRVGDEILFIRGQQRQSLYQLLVSRVHRNRVVAQYVQLVERWQGDFARAFASAQRTGLTEELLLERLRAMGSGLVSVGTIRNWVKRIVLAPLDAEDLLRVAKLFSLSFVAEYYKAIHLAGRRLKGLHIHLSTRLNRWLASGDAASTAVMADDDVIDSELGLTVDDFRQSLLRLKVLSTRTLPGRFYRGSLGRLEVAP